LNVKIGDTIYGQGKIIAPDSKIYEGYAIADQVGFYRLDDGEVGVNLLNSVESDISMTNSEEGFQDTVTKAKAEVKYDLTPIIILLCLAAILLEIYFIKSRGDL
jgi:hypothetical protein